MAERTLTVVNQLGLHARAAAKFVGVAKTFASDITLAHEGKSVDGKSIMNVMMLAAPLGSQIKLNVCGEDEDDALPTLVALIDEGFGEGRADDHPS